MVRLLYLESPQRNYSGGRGDQRVLSGFQKRHLYLWRRRTTYQAGKPVYSTLLEYRYNVMPSCMKVRSNPLAAFTFNF